MLTAAKKIIEIGHQKPSITKVFNQKTIMLEDGEIYAGVVLIGEILQAGYHLILVKVSKELLNWRDANIWAATQDATLPTKSELSIIQGNVKGVLQNDWHWSSDTNAISTETDVAYSHHFGNGYQTLDKKNDLLNAVCVRRLKI